MANALVAPEQVEPKNVAPAPNAGLQQAAAGPRRLADFLKDTRLEMTKVVTPTRDEVQQTTVVVLATVFIFAAYFWLVDVVLGHGIDRIFSWATRH